jgi:opacity protein-like surface antigen
LFAASTAFAQAPRSVDVFFGYSHSGGNVFTNSDLYVPRTQGIGMDGWEGSIQGKFLPWIGIMFDLAGHYGSHEFALCPPAGLGPCSRVNVHAGEHTYLLGPQLSFSTGKFDPFVHVLVGAAHVGDDHGGVSNSNTSIGTAIGGGTDYQLIPHIAARLQLDEIHTHLFSSKQDHLRFSLGLDARF